MTTKPLLVAVLLSATAAFAAAPLPFDTPPKAEKTVAANKPGNAETAGLVSLLVTVSVEGNVTESKVLKSTRPEFETPAQEAVMKWKFKPATKDGKPVEAKIVVPIRFSLEASE